MLNVGSPGRRCFLRLARLGTGFWLFLEQTMLVEHDVSSRWTGAKVTISGNVRCGYVGMLSPVSHGSKNRSRHRSTGNLCGTLLFLLGYVRTYICMTMLMYIEIYVCTFIYFSGVRRGNLHQCRCLLRSSLRLGARTYFAKAGANKERSQICVRSPCSRLRRPASTQGLNLDLYALFRQKHC